MWDDRSPTRPKWFFIPPWPAPVEIRIIEGIAQRHAFPLWDVIESGRMDVAPYTQRRWAEDLMERLVAAGGDAGNCTLTIHQQAERWVREYVEARESVDSEFADRVKRSRLRRDHTDRHEPGTQWTVTHFGAAVCTVVGAWADVWEDYNDPELLESTHADYRDATTPAGDEYASSRLGERVRGRDDRVVVELSVPSPEAPLPRGAVRVSEDGVPDDAGTRVLALIPTRVLFPWYPPAPEAGREMTFTSAVTNHIAVPCRVIGEWSAERAGFAGADSLEYVHDAREVAEAAPPGGGAFALPPATPKHGLLLIELTGVPDDAGHPLGALRVNAEGREVKSGGQVVMLAAARELQ